MHFFDVVVPVVERVGDVRRSPACFAAAEISVVDQRDLFACPCEQVGGGQAGNAAADDADIGPHIAPERLKPGHFHCLHPAGFCMAAIG